MVSINEIMIGNLFLWKGLTKWEDGRPVQVIEDKNSLTSGVQGIVLKGDKSYGSVKDLLPIKITSEILTAMGWERENNGWHIPPKPRGYMTDYFSLFDKNYCKGELDLYLNGSNLPMPQIKYIHQLQNIYFTIMGVPLNLNR
jgi:hypothetical protein